MSADPIPLAMVYDFDGTLAPGNMQESQFIPDVGATPGEFWAEVNARSQDEAADPILMYMRLMLEKANAARVPVHRQDFISRGARIQFFQGVEGWFGRINNYGASKGVAVEHYLISSGNSEIIAGTTIADRFKKIYASKFLYDHNDVPVWPALAINFTTKTQYLFRINKGAHDLSDNSKINNFVPQNERTVPFENIIYIGDGETDVPCFRLVKDLGGISIAVYDAGAHHLDEARQQAERYYTDGRVNCIAPAIYTDNCELDSIVKSYIDLVIARHRHRKSLGVASEET